MSCCRNLFLVFLVLGGLTASVIFYCCPDLVIDREPPELTDEYFGRGKVPSDPKQFPKDDSKIKKFQINIPDAVLVDLKRRLNNTRFVEPLDNVEFQYGFHSTYLRDVVDYWKNKFDWRSQEKKLNQFDQYITQIEGIDVHFIHQKPTVKDKKIKVYPLLMVHGWPGSIAEFTKLVPQLTTPRKDRNYVFEVICPSIPGYGFSEMPHQPGFSIASAARVFSKLMDRLGFPQFYTHGGDWGSAITSTMAVVYPKKVLGTHLTMVVDLGPMGTLKYIVGQLYPSLFMDAKQAEKIYPISKLSYFFLEELGYMHIQATKPDTLGASLMDSPTGLAAYILEKFSTWTDDSFRQIKDGGLTKKFTLDELLTNVMIYWSTNTITSSMRFYKEAFCEKFRSLKLKGIPIKVPVGIAAFPNELAMFPESFLKPGLRNLVRYTVMPRGGHFPAMEEPALLSDEIWNFVSDIEKAQQQQKN